MLKSESLKVVILCGGKGERLKPLTDSIPKPLVEIKGQPIIHYLLNFFEAQGFRHFVLTTGYQSHKFESYFAKHPRRSRVELLDSGDVDIVTRLNHATEKVGNEDFLVAYGDTLADVNLNKLVEFSQSHPGLVTMTNYPMRSQFGLAELSDSGQIKSFREKPILDKWINIGYYYFKREAQKYLRESSKMVDLFDTLVAQNQMYGFKHEGLHITVNTVQELSEAELSISQFENKLRQPLHFIGTADVAPQI